eukprot:4067745-Lingulodinium_polyedra.AAC.1
MRVFSFLMFDHGVVVVEGMDNALISLPWPAGPEHSRPVFRVRAPLDDEYLEVFPDGRILEAEFL